MECTGATRGTECPRQEGLGRIPRGRERPDPSTGTSKGTVVSVDIKCKKATGSSGRSHTNKQEQHAGGVAMEGGSLVAGEEGEGRGQVISTGNAEAHSILIWNSNTV